jgi:hypothetical protein
MSSSTRDSVADLLPQRSPGGTRLQGVVLEVLVGGIELARRRPGHMGNGHVRERGDAAFPSVKSRVTGGLFIVPLRDWVRRRNELSIVCGHGLA